MESTVVLAREQLLQLWDEGWSEGHSWYAPWSRALEGLTPEQAAWRAQPERHSIWQIAGHVVFWREVILTHAACGKVGEEGRARRNFEPPKEVTRAAWEELQRRFEQTHRRVRDAIADPETDLKNFQRLAFHETYHIGQIMSLRAMQGLPPME